jgi:hypothetical protein
MGRKQVRIISCGNFAKVIDLETGNDLAHSVTDITIDMQPGKVPLAIIHVMQPQVDVQAEAQIIEACPYCGREKEIEA